MRIGKNCTSFQKSLRRRTPVESDYSLENKDEVSDDETRSNTNSRKYRAIKTCC